jgi:hypothetical protein
MGEQVIYAGAYPALQQSGVSGRIRSRNERHRKGAGKSVS